MAVRTFVVVLALAGCAPVAPSLSSAQPAAPSVSPEPLADRVPARPGHANRSRHVARLSPPFQGSSTIRHVSGDETTALVAADYSPGR